jgi:hypothetical protein
MLIQRIADGRTRNTPHHDAIARVYRNWQFTAVQREKQNGELESTIFFSVGVNSGWRTNGSGGRGLVVIPHSGTQPHSRLDFTGDKFWEGLNHCGETTRDLSPPVKIDNAVFDSIDNVRIVAEGDMFYPCPARRHSSGARSVRGWAPRGAQAPAPGPRAMRSTRSSPPATTNFASSSDDWGLAERR